MVFIRISETSHGCVCVLALVNHCLIARNASDYILPLFFRPHQQQVREQKPERNFIWLGLKADFSKLFVIYHFILDVVERSMFYYLNPYRLLCLALHLVPFSHVVLLYMYLFH